MVAAFDVHDVNANPARFDLKKAEAINADAHPPARAARTSPARLVPVPAARRRAAAEPLDADSSSCSPPSPPLVQERVNCSSEATPMLGFLFYLADDALPVADDARGAAAGRRRAGARRRPRRARAGGASGTAADHRGRAAAALIDGLGLSRKLAFGPLRVGGLGTRVSPPLFESMEILGRDSTLARLRALRASL